MGRPATKITDEDLRQAELLAGYGLTQPQIAAVLGISERTFRAKKHEPRVSAALERGRARAEYQVGEALFARAVRGDVSAIRWWEMTRAGRSEKVDMRVEQELESVLDAMERELEPDEFRKVAGVLARASGG